MLSSAEAARILAVALAKPGGSEAVFAALARVPGVGYDPAQPGRRFRAATPPKLRVGDWTFSPTGTGTAVETAHTVRGVILSRATVAASEAAAKLALALLDAARQQGDEAEEYAESVISALNELLGL